jgi:hypothetical protein
MARGFLVECKNCREQKVIPEGQDPHHPVTGLKCPAPEVTGCCTLTHHHGQAADPVTGSGVPCRPVTFYANAVTELSTDGWRVLGGV